MYHSWPYYNTYFTCAQQIEFGHTGNFYNILGPTSEWYNTHMRLKNANIPIVKAVGNDGCRVSDAWTVGVKEALIVVGNTKMLKLKSFTESFADRAFCGINSVTTNYGKLVDIQAPGPHINGPIVSKIMLCLLCCRIFHTSRWAHGLLDFIVYCKVANTDVSVTPYYNII